MSIDVEVDLTDVEVAPEAVSYRSVPGKIPNGIFTVSSDKGHRTIKVKTVTEGNLAGKRIVYVMTGPDNVFNYTGVAFLKDDDELQIWKKMQGSELHKVVMAWHQIMQKETDPAMAIKWKDYTLQLAKQCVRCNRRLTTPESITMGIGPVCAQL